MSSAEQIDPPAETAPADNTEMLDAKRDNLLKIQKIKEREFNKPYDQKLFKLSIYSKCQVSTFRSFYFSFSRILCFYDYLH